MVNFATNTETKKRAGIGFFLCRYKIGSKVPKRCELVTSNDKPMSFLDKVLERNISLCEIFSRVHFYSRLTVGDLDIDKI